MNKLKKELLDDKKTMKFLESIAGPLATDIVKIFNTKSLSPEDISKKLNVKITTIRSTLNSLHYRGIACYKKTRDSKNMYEFLWEIRFQKIVDIILLQEMKKYKKIEQGIAEKENHDFFYCPKKCTEMPFELAAVYNFKCPNCGASLEILNTKNRLTKLKRDKTKIKKNIDRLETIIQKIEDNTKGYICD